MAKLIGVFLCLFALGVAALPATHGMAHGHGPAAMTMEEDRSKDPADGDLDEIEDCSVLPGHCSYTALTLDADIAATFYPTVTSAHVFDDESKPKFRPETELRPPRL